MHHNAPVISYDDRCIIVFSDNEELSGKLDSIYINDNEKTTFRITLPIETSAIYYFGTKPVKIIISNDSKKMSIVSDSFLLTSIEIDRKYNTYVMVIEATNEKYTRH